MYTGNGQPTSGAGGGWWSQTPRYDDGPSAQRPSGGTAAGTVPMLCTPVSSLPVPTAPAKPASAPLELPAGSRAIVIVFPPGALL